MMYLYWLMMVPVSVGFTLLAWLVAPILPLFARSEYGFCDNANRMAVEPRLPGWLSWFMTPDNSLWGDAGWRTEHCPNHWDSYLGMVLWLWRNPAYGFEWSGPLCAHIMPDAMVKYSGDPGVQNRPRGKAGYCFTRIFNPDGTAYWHLYLVAPVGGGYCLNINLGWKLKTYAEDPTRTQTGPRALYCFSPRVTAFVEDGNA